MKFETEDWDAISGNDRLGGHSATYGIDTLWGDGGDDWIDGGEGAVARDVHAVDVGLGGGAVDVALGRRPVVPDDVEDQRIR